MAARTPLQLASGISADVTNQPVVVPQLGFPFRLLALLALLPLLLCISLLAVYRQQQAERIYSGIQVFGVDVSRMTRDEAAGAVKAHLTETLRRPFHLRYVDGAVPVTLVSMGVRIDDAEIATIVERAWSIGREDQLRSWLRIQLNLLRRGHALPASLSYDRERAAALLGRVAFDVEQVTVNAGLSVQQAGERFEIHTSPAITGRVLNVDATLEQFQQALAKGIPSDLELVIEAAPPAVSDADLVPAISAIQALLSGPLEFRDGARVWRLETAAAYKMLEIGGLEQLTPPIVARLNEQKLAEFVQGVARQADQPARNPFLAVENDQIVVRPGTPGKLADVEATLELARARAVAPGEPRVVEIAFKEDPPWLTAADLEPARVQANALLDLPITLETPPLPEITSRKWTLERTHLAQMLVMPNTQSAPRDYATQPPAQRPRFEIALDSGRVTNFLAREIAPWVSTDPVNAELELVKTTVDVPNPAYTEQPPAATAPAATPVATPVPSRPSVPPTLQENRYTVGLKNARDGRGPDYTATFAGMQILFRSATPAEPAERRVEIRLTSRAPSVQDKDLAPARDAANTLIGEPIQVRWQARTWTVTRDELAGMLRYQPGSSGSPMAYLTRDGLIAKASAIAADLERSPEAPRTAEGAVRKVDVPATASAVWLQASTTATGRVAEVVLAEEEPAPETAG